jgi:murein DD-endopeptidase MepM/ murein hydrolase activator NlpD
VTKIAFTGLFALRVILPIAFMTVPDQAQASILSVVTSFFSAKAVSASDITPVNSQKMALLEAPVNANVNAARAAGDMHVEGSALAIDGSVDANDTILPQANNEIKSYTVETDDTISGVAKKFGVSTNTIIWANNLNRSSALKVGQNLVILPISGVQHKVTSGDTLQSIAKKYNGDVDEIVSYNDLQNNKVKVGEIIVIPDGEISVPTSSGTTVKPKNTSKKIAIVAPGASISVGEGSADGSGYYMRPIIGGIRTTGIHGNNGVDLAESCGSNLYASAAGTIIIAKGDGGWNGGYGNYVVISHSNGSQTLYAHMQALSVAMGDSVTQGQMIGLLGNTGKVHGVTGCHVHFEIRNGIRNPF